VRGVLYEAVSHGGGRIEAIELYEASGLLAAWAFVHFSDAEAAVVKEFYVWPWFQRRGFGTLLEFFVRYRAAVNRRRRIEVFIHDMDGLIGPVRARASHFVAASGYGWLWRAGRRPNLTALAVRELPAAEMNELRAE
jgi:hypothetical protein